MIQLDVINASTAFPNSQLEPLVAALTIQVNRDFFPFWGVPCTLHSVPKGAKPNLDHWWLVLLDDSDTAGALGYHDLTNSGLPIGKVFTKTDLTYGYKASVTASHELLEMLVDPSTNVCTLDSDNGILYARESADACEADEFGYDINGVSVSDFVTPAWFNTFWTNYKGKKPQFDFQKQITEPYQLLPGGYIGFIDLKNPSAGWQEYVDDKNSKGERHTLYAGRKPVGSRVERRKVSRGRWMCSTVEVDNPSK